jgi:hypothetical protein
LLAPLPLRFSVSWSLSRDRDEERDRLGREIKRVEDIEGWNEVLLLALRIL